MKGLMGRSLYDFWNTKDLNLIVKKTDVYAKKFR